MEEHMRFVLRLKDGESMASLCREFGISRVTGYKVYERYKECGLEGLTDRARTPYRGEPRPYKKLAGAFGVTNAIEFVVLFAWRFV